MPSRRSAVMAEGHAGGMLACELRLAVAAEAVHQIRLVVLGQHRHAECGDLRPEFAFELLDRVFEVDACCSDFLFDERCTLLQIAANVAHDRSPARPHDPILAP